MGNDHVAQPFRVLLSAIAPPAQPCAHPKAWAIIECEDCGQKVRVEPHRAAERMRDLLGRLVACSMVAPVPRSHRIEVDPRDIAEARALLRELGA